MTECVNPNIIRCLDGWHKAGWDKAGCGVSPAIYRSGQLFYFTILILWISLAENSSAAPLLLSPDRVPVRMTLFDSEIDTDTEKLEGRGSGSDCNGQCHSGEAILFKSSRWVSLGALS